MKHGRNDPCQCGSGRKYKNCCADKLSDKPRSTNMLRAALIAGAAGILALVIVMPNRSDDQAERDVLPQSSTPAVLPVATPPAPWAYDAASNRHWHPEHGHWHDGPPPSQTNLPSGNVTSPGSPEATAPAASTPAPWQYDAASNRHWHPDHGHWHDGPPPSSPNGESAIR